jgi:hypothetical protein
MGSGLEGRVCKKRTGGRRNGTKKLDENQEQELREQKSKNGEE